MFGGKKEKKSDPMSGGLLGLGEKIAGKTQPNKSLCPSMSLRHRTYGWGICFVLGMVIAMASSGTLKTMAQGSYLKFGILYASGTIITLAASMFLWGPRA